MASKMVALARFDDFNTADHIRQRLEEAGMHPVLADSGMAEATTTEMGFESRKRIEIRVPIQEGRMAADIVDEELEMLDDEESELPFAHG